MRRLVEPYQAACCLCDELFSNIQTPNQLKKTILINYYVCVDNYRLADLILPIINKHSNYKLLYLSGPKLYRTIWLWAEIDMGRDVQ